MTYAERMKRAEGRSDCPTNFTVEAFGDSWALLILRDILTRGKHTFSEFLASDERIGPSVLAERLATLERRGIIERRPSATDARSVVYTATERGIAAIPLLYETVRWGIDGLPVEDDDPYREVLAMDRDTIIDQWTAAARQGESLFAGRANAYSRLEAMLADGTLEPTT